MEKTYNPSQIEQKYYKKWEENNYFSSDRNSNSKNNYCIMLPPPNITGHLHMGHAFQHTIMDVLIRYHRMIGDKTLWQTGTDHAGIATQMVVERMLNAEGKSRHDFGRDGFIDKVWEWKHQSGGTITKQMRRLGSSVDWNKERFTMDDELSKAVTKVFVDLYNEGLIYRGKRLVNWDPVLMTAVSDLEVISKEEDGFMWYVNYPFIDGSGFMQIATTRPETILVDGALAVHPNDEKNKKYVGKEVQVPLTDRVIKVITDEYVDAEFGSGCVKITAAHDFNDYEVYKRHLDIPLINLYNPDARLNENAPKKYQGLDRFEARKQIVKDLTTAGLLIKTKKHKYKLPRSDRTNAIVEPYLTEQWFVRIKPLAMPAVDAVKNGYIKFIPKNWENTYFNWMENIEDWCISRQIWWGHRVPAWYDENNNVFVANSKNAAQKIAGKGIKLTQDNDVLDTWFSSALWPFSTLGWPEKTQDLKDFYPTNVLVTGFDIIFFWVARMIMFGLKFSKDIPFKDIYITGLIRDSHGQKMSKSKGNVLDPLDVINGISLDELIKKRTYGLMQPQKAKEIEKHTKEDFPHGIDAFGTDALRFTFVSLASFSRDINFDLNKVNGYRNFCNKLWNAARFVLLNLDNETTINDNIKLSVADMWILSKLQNIKNNINKHLDNYRLDLMSQTLYDFIWHDYCDWYLELAKPLLNDNDTSKATKYTLIKVLDEILKLIHPIIPFISEHIYNQTKSYVKNSAKSLVISDYPKIDDNLINVKAEEEISWLQKTILEIRKIRGETNIAPNKKLSVFLQNTNNLYKLYLKNNYNLLVSVAKLEKINLLEKEVDFEVSVGLVGDMKILIPLADLIDKKEESKRLNKEIIKLNKQLEFISKKLNNPKFVSGAPLKIVSKEKEKYRELKKTRDNLNIQYQKISQL